MQTSREDYGPARTITDDYSRLQTANYRRVLTIIDAFGRLQIITDEYRVAEVFSARAWTTRHGRSRAPKMSTTFHGQRETAEVFGARSWTFEVALREQPSTKDFEYFARIAKRSRSLRYSLADFCRCLAAENEHRRFCFFSREAEK